MLGDHKVLLPQVGMFAAAIAIAVGIGTVMQSGENSHLAAMNATPETTQQVLPDVAFLPPVNLPSAPPTKPDLSLATVTVQSQISQVSPAVPEAPSVSAVQMTSSNPAVENPDSLPSVSVPPSLGGTAVACAARIEA